MLEKLFGCDCGEKKNIKLEGDALEAVQSFRATMEGLKKQGDAARAEMWAAIQKATGTEHVGIGDLCLDTKYLDEFGIAILKVPVEKVSASAAGTDEGGGTVVAAEDGDVVAKAA